MSDVISITRGENITPYETAIAAFEAVESGDIVTLLEDCSLSKTVSIETKVILDLNGHTLTATAGSSVFTVNVGGNLTVKDTSESSSGELVHTKQSAIYLVNTSDLTRRPVFTLESGTIQAQEFGVCTFGGGVINVKGGTIIAKDNGAVGSNGSNTSAKPYGQYPYEINISGGNIFANTESEGYANCGIYHANAGVVNISGGNIVSTAGAGVVVRAGSLNVTGGSISGQGNTSGMKMGDANPTYCGGVEICNAANYPGKMGTTIISGGEISSACNYGILVIGSPDDSHYPNSSASKVVVSGGEVSGELGAVGFVTKNGEDIEDTSESKLVIVGGDFSSDVEAYIDESVNLTKEYGPDGELHYVIKDGLKAVIAYLDEMLDSGNTHDEETLRLLNQVLSNIEQVIEKADASIESIDNVAGKVDTSNSELGSIKEKLDEAKTQLASILETTQAAKDTLDDIKETDDHISSTSDSILTTSENIKDKTTAMDAKLENIIAINTQIANLQKKTVEEIAKIYGDDPAEIIGDDDKPHTHEDPEILSVQALIMNAKKTGQTTALWQHPMTDKVREYLAGQGCTVIVNPTAKVGDQWLITIPE